MFFLFGLVLFGAPSLVAAVVPVVRPDPMEAQLTPVTSGPVWRSFCAATQYLRQVPQAGRILKRLEASPITYRIEILTPGRTVGNSGTNEFNAAQNVVQWDPTTGLAWSGPWSSRQAHSAAIGLMHELGHAYHKDNDSAKFSRFCGTKTFDSWGNLEEKRTILEIENPIARALGESERFFHQESAFYKCELFASTTPTSTVVAKKQAVFRPVPSRNGSFDRKLADLRRRAGWM